MKKIIQTLTKYGILSLVFLIPLQTRWIIKQGILAGSSWEYGTISLYGTDILFLLVFALFLFGYGGEDAHPRFRGAVKRPSSIWFTLVAFLIISFLSIYWAGNQEVAIIAFIRLLEGAGLFWMIWKMSWKKQMMIAWIASAVGQSILAIWQMIVRYIPANKWFGLAAQDPGILGTPVIETAVSRSLRAFGSFPHPNILGGFLIIALVFLFYFYAVHACRRGNVSSPTWNWQLALSVASILVITTGMCLSFSRSAWLALVLVIITLFIFQKNRAIVARYALLILIPAIVFTVLAPDLVFSRLSLGDRVEAISVSQRSAQYIESFKLVKDYFLQGVGIGNYTSAIYDQVDSGKKYWEYQPAHNSFLLILTEIGVFGLLVFVILLIYLVKNIGIKKNPLGLAILTSLLILLIFDHYSWSLRAGALILWSGLGLLRE